MSQTFIYKMPVVDLNEVLRYPGKTLCEIISSFQKYLEINQLIERDRLF